MRRALTAFATTALVALAALPVAAQDYGRAPMVGKSAEGGTPQGVRDVGIDQRLGEQVPVDLQFVDETGRTTSLAEIARRSGEARPVMLVPAYYGCPMLCTLVLNGTMTTLSTLPFTAGDEFEVVVVSIDPDETPEMAAEAKERYLRRYDRPEGADGLHFLTGDEAEIRAVMDAVGFRYAYQPDNDEWAHAAGLMLLTPDGRVARYFYGVEYAPRDVRLGLVEAGEGKLGSAVDEVLLYCFRYDPATGQYSTAVLAILRLAGLVTLVAIGIYFLVSRRRSLTTSLGKA
jgi:protein SCO1/2